MERALGTSRDTGEGRRRRDDALVDDLDLSLVFFIVLVVLPLLIVFTSSWDSSAYSRTSRDGRGHTRRASLCSDRDET
jgi:hypothetical protein